MDTEGARSCPARPPPWAGPRAAACLLTAEWITPSVTASSRAQWKEPVRSETHTTAKRLSAGAGGVDAAAQSVSTHACPCALPCLPDDPWLPGSPACVTVLGSDGQITGRSSNYMIKKGDEGEELQPLRPPKDSSHDRPQPAGPGAELRVLRQPGEAENGGGARPAPSPTNHSAPRASCWRSARLPSPDPSWSVLPASPCPGSPPAATTVSLVFSLGLKLTSGRCPRHPPPPPARS